MAERDGVFEFAFLLFTAVSRGSLSSSESTRSRESRFSSAFYLLSFSDFSDEMALEMALARTGSERSPCHHCLQGGSFREDSHTERSESATHAAAIRAITERGGGRHGDHHGVLRNHPLLGSASPGSRVAGPTAAGPVCAALHSAQLDGSDRQRGLTRSRTFVPKSTRCR